jgi:hypothetical protein
MKKWNLRSEAQVVPEADVQKQILTLLQMRRIPAWRNNTGAAWLPGAGGKMRPVRFSIPGAADVFAILPPNGTFLAIECKRSKGGTHSDEQKAFGRMVRDAGGIYVLARSVQDVLEVLGR